MLNERGTCFVMRSDIVSGGWRALRDFMRGNKAEAMVTLSAPEARDAADWACSAEAPSVRLVRNVSAGAKLRVLLTNLPADQVPAAAFGELCHQRWRIEEAFKRPKHRTHLEAVSGLSQQALLVDVAAKVLADNITALMCLAVQANADATNATAMPPNSPSFGHAATAARSVAVHRQRARHDQRRIAHHQ